MNLLNTPLCRKRKLTVYLYSVHHILYIEDISPITRKVRFVVEQRNTIQAYKVQHHLNHVCACECVCVCCINDENVCLNFKLIDMYRYVKC